jgi:aquaporin Z
MLSACGFAVALFHPVSPVVEAIPSDLGRRGLMGIAMALTLMLNVYSPWGRRSGAHMNPAMTLTFWRLKKVSGGDLAGYIGAQFAGGLAGTLLAAWLFRPWIADPSVNYAATVPSAGAGVAFAAEVGISALLMFVVRVVSSHQRLARWTGVIAGLLVAGYITLETPVSGMSMNPARTVGSAAFAGVWTGWWVYFTAPLLGMLLGAALHARLSSADACAKLMHDPRYRCVFCGHPGSAG